MMSTGQPIDLKRLEGRLLSLGITLTEAKLDMLYRYAGLLCEYNERLNLTAITDPEGIEEKHFIDSILPLKLFEIPKHASVIDIGTGAGFPGIPWKIAREDIDLYLFDSLRKRLDFLLAVLGSLGLEARLVHGRAEDFGKKELRESFDIAVARAVAGLPVLSEYCLPFVKPGGVLAALKGPDIGLELDSAKNAIKTLGGRVEDIKEYSLPSGDKRTLVVIKKASKTPPGYPRPRSRMLKNPL